MKRKAGLWTVDKLAFVEEYIPYFLQATKKALGTHYVDGFAGPGKNEVEDTKHIHDGTPLIALKTNGFANYFLVEKKKQLYTSLEDCAKETVPYKEGRVWMRQGDFNVLVKDITAQIHPKAPTFYVLDPEGLELDWTTVEHIGQRDRADVFVLISASGVNRNLNQPGAESTLTRFFGGEVWKAVDYPNFHAFTDLYVSRLRELGFTDTNRFLIARNSQNVPMHALVFAAKKPFAANIADAVMRRIASRGQGRLF